MVIPRLSIVGYDCTNCGATMAESLKCPGCGWVDPLTRRPPKPPTKVDEIAVVMMEAWEKAEGKPVNVSYVATFADMARAVVEWMENG